MTLTFRNVQWSTPAECKEWIRSRTQALRLFLVPTGKSADALSRQRWRVRGYLATWEVTQGRDGLYHPHLHLVVLSAFIPYRQLRKQWEAHFGAWNCDVRSIKNGPQAIGYVLKYLGKAWKGVPEDVQVLGFYRTKRLTSQGEFYGKRMDALLMSGPTQAMGAERSNVRLHCPECGCAQPEACAIVPNERKSKRIPDPWRAPPEWAPFGKPWRSPEWENGGPMRPKAEVVRDLGTPAATMALDWSGVMLWDDVQRVQLS